MGKGGRKPFKIKANEPQKMDDKSLCDKANVKLIGTMYKQIFKENFKHNDTKIKQNISKSALPFHSSRKEC